MRALVISDIHDNLTCLEKVLTKYHKHHCNLLIILGDICTFKEDFRDLLKPFSNVILIKGNNDSSLTEDILQSKLLKEKYLTINNQLFYLSHGEYLRLDGDLNIKRNAIILFGHYHIPLYKVVKGRIYLNPGSVSKDRSGLGESYLILEEDFAICFTLDDRLIFSKEFKKDLALN